MDKMPVSTAGDDTMTFVVMIQLPSNNGDLGIPADHLSMETNFFVAIGLY
jgi:hypothetical protein